MGKLPKALSFGAVVQVKGGMILIGGCDGKKYIDEVYLLQWDSSNKQVIIKIVQTSTSRFTALVNTR